MQSFFLCNGDETQEIVKPTGAHDLRFRRFIGMVCTRKRGIVDLCNLINARQLQFVLHLSCEKTYIEKINTVRNSRGERKWQRIRN